MGNPSWYRLIKLLLSDGTIKNGITIPYLFGAYKLLGYDIQNIKQLLEIMINEPADEFALIEKCDMILQDVIKLQSKRTVHKNKEVKHKLPNADKTNYLLISYNTNLGETIDRVGTRLTSLYETPVNKKKYSYKKKNWQEFDDTETKKILSLK